MEFQELPDNDETIGFSKRRISSILKVPRKSQARFTDQEQQENVVECTKPFEKRSSKRVSFAPGNDVLVFSKDVKGTISSQNPFQEMQTSAGDPIQNRVLGLADGTKNMDILGIQSLLNAPLHASQNKIGCDRDDGRGEKTVLFSSDDAFMDMTQSHSINVAHCAERLGDGDFHSSEGFPNFGEKTVLFTANDASMDLTLNQTMKTTLEGNASCHDSRHLDLNVAKRGLPSNSSIVDAGFEKFLASLSKPNHPASNNTFPRIGSETSDVDKENRLPTSMKSISTFKKHAEEPQCSVLVPDNDVSMNLTEVQSACILGNTDTTNPFQFLLPPKDMCVSTDKRVPQKNETRRTSSVPKEITFTKNTSQSASSKKLRVNFDVEKTILFNTDDDFMDATRSCTVNISRAVTEPQKVSADGLELEFNNFFTGLSKPPELSSNRMSSGPGSTKDSGDTDMSTARSVVHKADRSLNMRGSCRKSYSGKEDPVADVDMDLTEARTTHLAHSAGPLHFLFPTKEPQNTGVRTSLKSAVNPSMQKHQFGEDAHQEPPAPSSSQCGESDMFCLEGDISMDMTEAQTGRIVGITHPEYCPLQAAAAILEQTSGSNTVCPEVDLSMDMTEAQTGRIVGITVNDAPQSCLASHGVYPEAGDPKHQTDSVPNTKKHQPGPTPNRASLAPNGRRPSTAPPTYNSEVFTAFCPDGDVSMDMTEAQTGRIFGVTPTDGAHLCLSTTQPFTPEGVGNSKSNHNCESHGEVRGRASPALKTRLSTAAPPSNNDLSTVTCPDSDVSMEMTQAQTGRIVGITLAHQEPLCYSALQGSLPPCSDLKIQTEVMSTQMGHFVTGSALPQTKKKQFGPTTGRPSLGLHAKMSSSVPPSSLSEDFTPAFPDEDMSMDMTEAQTGRIFGVTPTDGAHLFLSTTQPFSPEGGSNPKINQDYENYGAPRGRASLALKTRRPSTAASLSNPRHSTVICPDGDMSMDMTEAQTGRNFGVVPSDEASQFPSSAAKHETHGPDFHFTPSILNAKTPSTAAPFTNDDESVPVRNGCDVSMDMTEAQTVGILGVRDADDPEQCGSTSQGAFQPTLPPGLSVSTGLGKPLVERCQMTGSKVEEDLLGVDEAFPNEGILSRQEPLQKSTRRKTDLPQTVKTTQKNRSLSARGLSLGLKNSFHLTAVPWTNAATGKPVTTADQQGVEEALGRANGSLNEPTRNFTNIYMNMDMEEVERGHTLRLASDLPQTEDPDPNLREATSPQVNTQMDTHCSETMADSTKTMTKEDPEDKSEPPLTNKIESLSSASVEQSGEEPCSRRSRRISLANLQSKARRLSQMINATSEAVTSTVAQIDQDSDLPSVAPEPVRDITGFKPQDESPSSEEALTTVPHQLNSKLMSRLSMGTFKPKLPQRNTSNDTKKISDSDVTRTMNITAHLGNGDKDVSDIYEEELGSYEDVSETLDNSSPRKIFTESGLLYELDSKESEGDIRDEETVTGKKRSLPEEENGRDENLKRRRPSTENKTVGLEMHHQSLQGSDSNTVPNTTSHTTDYSSSSHTSSMRCEATFESTFKQSMFESQLEDYSSDAQRKLDDGSITVLEFLKLFNIDFVIHNPRQSVLPGKIPLETQQTQLDMLKNRHVSRPRQLVYGADVQKLTEKVDGLKMRTQDLDKPLRTVNKQLWEEMRNSSEKELKSFGTSLRERNNYFRKMGKAQSHEMKEVLYRNLVQTNQEEQKKLRGTIDRADEMIKSLDECICQLESELAEVEEKGSEEKPSLKSLQGEMLRVTDAVAERERQMSQSELQMKQNSSKIERLRVETKDLQNHVNMLQLITEWRFGNRTEDSTVYSFLYDSVHLQVLYGKSQETAADGHSERKIKDIAFTFRLNDEASGCHARLVHRLVSQFIRSQKSWVDKYPTSGHVPQLLHDVSLVVSRCRLLGEELRLLKMWGATKLDILDLACLDTRVHMVFSSLRKLSKFQVVFSITVTNRLCVVKVERCGNIYGQAEIQKIDEIVASFTPGRNVFTKIIKKIHADLLT